MSFGFSIGDIIAVATLAEKIHRNVYTVARNAPEDVQSIEKDLASLCQSLRILQLDLQDSESVLRKAGEERARLLRGLIDRTHEILNKTDVLLKKHKIVGAPDRPTMKKILERLKYTRDASEIKGVRSQLQYHNTVMSLILTSLGNSSLQRLEDSSKDIKEGIASIKDLMQNSVSGSNVPRKQQVDPFLQVVFEPFRHEAEKTRHLYYHSIDFWLNVAKHWLNLAHERRQNMSGSGYSQNVIVANMRQSHMDILKASWIAIEVIPEHPQKVFIYNTERHRALNDIFRGVKQELADFDRDGVSKLTTDKLHTCDPRLWYNDEVDEISEKLKPNLSPHKKIQNLRLEDVTVIYQIDKDNARSWNLDLCPHVLPNAWFDAKGTLHGNILLASVSPDAPPAPSYAIFLSSNQGLNQICVEVSANRSGQNTDRSESKMMMMYHDYLQYESSGFPQSTGRGLIELTFLPALPDAVAEWRTLFHLAGSIQDQAPSFSINIPCTRWSLENALIYEHALLRAVETTYAIPRLSSGHFHVLASRNVRSARVSLSDLADYIVKVSSEMNLIPVPTSSRARIAWPFDFESSALGKLMALADAHVGASRSSSSVWNAIRWVSDQAPASLAELLLEFLAFLAHRALSSRKPELQEAVKEESLCVGVICIPLFALSDQFPSVCAAEYLGAISKLRSSTWQLDVTALLKHLAFVHDTAALFREKRRRECRRPTGSPPFGGLAPFDAREWDRRRRPTRYVPFGCRWHENHGEPPYFIFLVPTEEEVHPERPRSWKNYECSCQTHQTQMSVEEIMASAESALDGFVHGFLKP